MKKVMTFVLMLCLMYVFTPSVKADSNYQSFETLDIESGKLLEDFSTSDYKTYYKKVTKRKFMGWRTYTVNKNIDCSYISETMFSYYNDGYSPISYHYELEQNASSKLSLSASGSLGVKSSKSVPKFKNNLDASLKLSADYTQMTDEKTSVEIDFDVDPGTQVDLYVYGEGKITNGVAARYVFWFRAQKGGFELFLVTTQYQRLEKVKI